jgi:hypothetical protein
MISKVSLATFEGEELFCCGDALQDVTYIQKILEGAKKWYQSLFLGGI